MMTSHIRASKWKQTCTATTRYYKQKCKLVLGKVESIAATWKEFEEETCPRTYQK